MTEKNPSDDGTPRTGAMSSDAGAVPPSSSGAGGAAPPLDSAPPPGDLPPGDVPPGAVPPPGPGWAGLPPTLVRPRTDRVFRGVCTAVGRATGTDPVLWRVLAVVLTIFGGSGIVLYLAGWLVIPEEGRGESEAQRLLRGGRVSTPATVVAVVIGVIAVGAVLGDGRGAVPVLVVAVLAFLVARTRREPAPVGAVPAGWTTSPGWTAPATGPWGRTAAPEWAPPATGWAGSPYAAPQATKDERPPSGHLGRLTVSAVVLTVGALLLAAALGASGITASVVVAAALLVTGLGLLVGARWGRSRWLIALAVVLALALAATTSADRTWSSSTGDRTWVVTGASTHKLGAGDATLDLRPLSTAELTDVPVQARVGVGHLVVLVPADLPVQLDAHVSAGEVRVVGPDGDVTDEQGTSLHRVTSFGPDGTRVVRLDVHVGLGELEVRRVAE